MELRLFGRPVFSGVVVGAVAASVAMNMTLLDTLYPQHTREWTPLAAGVATLPLAVGATVCASWSGRMVGGTGPRLPLLFAGGFLTAGGPCLVRLTPHTSVLLLVAAYSLIGIGFGFANAPITNTAVNGLPLARAGVAGAITSTARQLGFAAGIALAGGLVTPPARRGSLTPPARAGSWSPPVAYCSSSSPTYHGRRRPPRAPLPTSAMSRMTHRNAPLSVEGRRRFVERCRTPEGSVC